MIYDFESSVSFTIVVSRLGDGTVSTALFDPEDGPNAMPAIEVLNANNAGYAVAALIGAMEFDRALADAAVVDGAGDER